LIQLKNILHTKYPLLLWWVIWYFSISFLIDHYYVIGVAAYSYSGVIHSLLLIATWSSYQNLFFNSKTENSHFARIIYVFLLTYLVYFLQKEILTKLTDVRTSEFLRNNELLIFIYDFLSLSFAIYFNWINKIIKEKNDFIEREKAVEKEKSLYEITILKQQLQPHFLFNSLNSINSLIQIEPIKAQEMTNKLSDFFRLSLKNQQKKLIPLSDELSFIKAYLEIEQIRFEDRLTINYTIEEESLNKEIPSLLTQPLIENCIKHGVYETLGKVEITINCKIHNEKLLINITNTCEENNYSLEKKGNSFGLHSVQKRLFLTYGIDHLMSYQRTEHLFSVTLQIPQK
jgi:two-component system LytT family sensor kinase